MLNIQTRQMELTGTNYEIGYQLGKALSTLPQKKEQYTLETEGLGSDLAKEAVRLFDRWCPGLNDELAGFADALDAAPEKIIYYAMTYLIPRCSQIALLPGIAAEGKPLLARSYEFHYEAEDFCLMKTAVKGKYTHMGTSVLSFGRDDGFNEHGLAVAMSSCGLPVGATPYMRAPKLKGLQFWACLRSVLENCKDVDEALSYLREMPIAYNLNRILLDKKGRAALYETLDGRAAFKRLEPDSSEQMLHAANHAVLPELAMLEPQVMAHSARRYEYIAQQLSGKRGITKEMLKELLLSKYPDGLCCSYFDDFFGTTKSMVISPSDGTIDLCWGGRIENGWHSYNIKHPLENRTQAIGIAPEQAAPGTYDWQPLP